MSIKGVNLTVESVRDALRTAAVSRVLMDLKRGLITEEQAREQIEAIKYDFDRLQPEEATKK